MITYEVTFTAVECDHRTTQTVFAEAPAAAAWLRAIADQIDPPKRPMRGGIVGQPANVVIHQDGPGPASGVLPALRAELEKEARVQGRGPR